MWTNRKDSAIVADALSTDGTGPLTLEIYDLFAFLYMGFVRIVGDWDRFDAM